MEKGLKNRRATSTADADASREASVMSGQSMHDTRYNAYGERQFTDEIFGSTTNVNDSARLYTDPHEETDRAIGQGDPLYKSLGGRLLTQSIARYFGGALFFAAGSYMLHVWKPGADFEDQHVLARGPEALSRMFDATLGRLETSAVSLFTDEATAKQIMTFNKHHAKSYLVDEALDTFGSGVTISNPLTNEQVYGMSLGQETVERTFAFASGSIGAAWFRNLVSIFDQNYNTSWLKDGKIDYKDMATSSAKEFAHIMLYNQGEDWFAGLIYPWQLRAARGTFSNGLDTYFSDDPEQRGGLGALIGLQNGQDGANRRVHIENGQATLGNSYEGAGALDYQSRFMGYNFYTLVYRDLYNHVSGHVLPGAWEGLKENGFNLGAIDLGKIIPENPLETVKHNAAETTKYLAKSYLKSQIYMAPAMMAFWPGRVGMAKANHGLTDGSNGTPITTQATRPFDPTNAEHLAQPFVDANGVTPPHKGIFADVSDIRLGSPLYSNDQQFKLHQPLYDPYADQADKMGVVVNGWGEAGANYKDTLQKNYGQPMGEVLEVFSERALDDPTAHGKQFMGNLAAAQMQYVTYMASKYETAQLYDTPEMDAAAYRMLDGIGALDAREALAGAKDVGNLIFMRDISEETRERVGEERGLINSRYEAHCRNEKSLEALKHEKWERKKEQGNTDEIYGVQDSTPSASVGDVEHDGVAANNMVKFKRSKSAPDSEQRPWTSRSLRDKGDASCEREEVGAGI